jgi:hypothetical protein
MFKKDECAATSRNGFGECREMIAPPRVGWLLYGLRIVRGLVAGAGMAFLGQSEDRASVHALVLLEHPLPASGVPFDVELGP